MTGPPKNTDHKPFKRSWLGFSLKFLLGIVLLVCIGLAYVVNQLQQEIPLPVTWDFETGKNVKWSIPLGTQTYSTPTVYENFVFVGSNNGNGYDPKRPQNQDLGVMLCFEKSTGKFLWQHANEKHPAGRVHDWPLQGVTAQAFAEKGWLWYVNNRGQVVCLDADGFRDGKNDGETNEPSTRPIDADVIWKVDLIERYKVFPHNISHCNVVVDSKNVYIKTSNGVDPSHANLPSPDAPSFVVLDRETGETVWTDNSPGRYVMHGSWGSPCLARIAGKRQILFPGGDGWLYSFEPDGDGNGNSVLLWKFDCNPKTARFIAGGRGNRNNLLAAPTVFGDRIYITMGQDPEHGGGPSRVWCIEPGQRRGDISPTLVTLGENRDLAKPLDYEFRNCWSELGDVETENPNSGAVWEYTGKDSAGDGNTDSEPLKMSRSLSEVVVDNGLVYVNDLDGILHCLDAATGQLKWTFDGQATMWNSPLVVGELVYLFNEDGQAVILDSQQDKDCVTAKAIEIIDMPNYSSVYANVTVKGGVLYIATRCGLIAIEDPSGRNQLQKWLR